MTLEIAFMGLQHAHARAKLRAAASHPDVALLGAYEPEPRVRATIDDDPLCGRFHWFASAEELLASSSLGAVIIDGAEHQNHELALAALRAGQPILLEKPAGLAPGQWESLRQEADDRGLYVQIGYQLRYTPAFRFMRRAVAEGLLGRVFEFCARMGKDRTSYQRMAEQATHYRGGIFFELGCHVLDMAIALLGQPTGVHGTLRTDGDSASGLADNTVVVVEFAQAVAILEASVLESLPVREIGLYGASGTLLAREVAPSEFDLGLAQASDPWASGWQKVLLERAPLFAGDLAELAAVVTGSKAPEYSAAHDTLVQTTLLRACGWSP
jgi:predicted dehydrogenase